MVAALSIRDSRSNFQNVFDRQIERRAEHLDLREIAALRSIDQVAPPSALERPEDVVQRFRAQPTSGDHLRLKQLTHKDGAEIRASLRRVTQMDLKATAAPSRELAIREAQMHKVLGALLSTYEQIQGQTRVLIGG